jgi:EAL domain-containing protein (putative c-di-GMP-specific phosphodiesterase class I)
MRPTGAGLESLVFHYQPIVSATTGRLVAAEALARAPLADGTLGSAQALLAHAERAGQSFAIDRLAVSSVLCQSVAWRTGGLPVPMHVNVSASTLSYVDAEKFVGWLQTLDVDAASLTLEITESVHYDDVERLADVAASCRAAGVEIAVDDFGCGYSTMALLQIIEADVLKIDRRFVAPLLFDERTRVLVRHFIGMAHELGMRVIAEGVEEPAQAAWLVRAGCDELQGFAFARAMSPDDFFGWALDRRARPRLPA